MRILQKRSFRWLIAVILIAALIGLVGYQFFEPGWRYRVRGVDVSHHQGRVDWNALAADGTDFAYIKATEGGDWTDPMFGSNWQAAGEAGVLRGAYHFFTLCRPGVDQASHMIDVVPDEPGMLPPAVDLEFGGSTRMRFRVMGEKRYVYSPDQYEASATIEVLESGPAAMPVDIFDTSNFTPLWGDGPVVTTAVTP